MKRFLVFVAMATAGILGSVAPTEAALITYTETATASGTLGTTPFEDALITLTLTGDTSGIFSPYPQLPEALMNPGTATIDIAGLGTASLNDPNGYAAAFCPFNPETGPVDPTPGFAIVQFDEPTKLRPYSGRVKQQPGRVRSSKPDRTPDGRRLGSCEWAALQLLNNPWCPQVRRKQRRGPRDSHCDDISP
jgi:hypothetical protein